MLVVSIIIVFATVGCMCNVVMAQVKMNLSRYSDGSVADREKAKALLEAANVTNVAAAPSAWMRVMEAYPDCSGGGVTEDGFSLNTCISNDPQGVMVSYDGATFTVFHYGDTACSGDPLGSESFAPSSSCEAMDWLGFKYATVAYYVGATPWKDFGESWAAALNYGDDACSSDATSYQAIKIGACNGEYKPQSCGGGDLELITYTQPSCSGDSSMVSVPTDKCSSGTTYVCL